MVTERKVWIAFGNQLFHPRHLRAHRDATVVLVEDMALCRRYRYHRQKLLFVIEAMRAYARTLRKAGFEVRHFRLDDGMSWREALSSVAEDKSATVLCHFEIESPGLDEAVRKFAARHDLERRVITTPMFIDTREAFAAHVSGRRAVRLAPYYQSMRQRLDVLLTDDGAPIGGRWSFDQDNRKKLPRSVSPPAPNVAKASRSLAGTRREIADRFEDHPGGMEEFWLPVTHESAEHWLDDFLVHRFHDFGPYEDALTERSDFVYHSGLSPLLNVGLLTPHEVLGRALEFARKENVPLNSLEGFVRQLIGWREFVHGVFHTSRDTLETGNVWAGDRALSHAWYEGTTGLDPLDHVIEKTLRLGYAHHIERLMVVANVMNLCGVHPTHAYRWFMEMFVDAYEWVMVPNVFGMGLASDGGTFTTKPYVCASNYLRKMGDYPAGDWCEVMDGLYWRFIAKHADRLTANPRMRPIVANAKRVLERRPAALGAADAFIERVTVPMGDQVPA